MIPNTFKEKSGNLMLSGSWMLKKVYNSMSIWTHTREVAFLTTKVVNDLMHLSMVLEKISYVTDILKVLSYIKICLKPYWLLW